MKRVPTLLAAALLLLLGAHAGRLPDLRDADTFGSDAETGSSGLSWLSGLSKKKRDDETTRIAIRWAGGRARTGAQRAGLTRRRHAMPRPRYFSQ
jgi:hypothetical protein